MTDTLDRERHWQGVYAGKAADAVSWYQTTPETSLALIGEAGARPTDPVIDVGGGASRLVDHLVQAGFADVSVLDVAAASMAAARARMGAAGDAVTWIAADITAWTPPKRYRVWHDRAVFHFLTDAADRAAYVGALEAALTADGTAIVATFAPDGPEKCSGLPVERYDRAKLSAALGAGFTVTGERRETHVTPGGGTQAFVYFLIRRLSPLGAGPPARP